MMKLPTLRGLFNDPHEESAIEQWLATPLQTDPTIQDNMQLYYARLCASMAQLEFHRAMLQLRHDKLYFKELRLLQSTQDDVTKKLFSIDAAERVLKCDNSIIKLKEQLAECTRRMAILKGYIKAFEMKSRHLPGAQGSMNRDKEMEMTSRRQRQ